MPKHINYNRNVFINCPFDDEYFKLLKPLVFVIVYFGFIPRISLESSDSGKARIKKIISLIKESKFAIHDLSRLQAKTVDEYYRLNMPFELGLDYGLRVFDTNFSDKKSLILETKQFEYMKAISDINGFDIKNHEDNPEKLVECLRSWFIETVNLRDLKSSGKIYSDFIAFNTNLFLEKTKKYTSDHSLSEAEKFAISEIKEMPLPEYIDEIGKIYT